MNKTKTAEGESSPERLNTPEVNITPYAGNWLLAFLLGVPPLLLTLWALIGYMSGRSDILQDDGSLGTLAVDLSQFVTVPLIAIGALFGVVNILGISTSYAKSRPQIFTLAASVVVLICGSLALFADVILKSLG